MTNGSHEEPPRHLTAEIAQLAEKGFALASPRSPRLKRVWRLVRYKVGTGGLAHFVHRGARGDFLQGEAARRHLDDGELGDDQGDDLQAGQRQRALLEDLVAAVLRRVLHRDADAPG